MQKCILCEKEFKDNRGRRRCQSCNTKIRRYRTKARAIKLLGGKCAICGYDKNHAALEFHHLDPSKKEFNIGQVANKSWKSICDEVSKCQLLCANCHKIYHSTRHEQKFLDEVENYRGKILL